MPNDGPQGVAIRRPLLPKGSNNETATHASYLLRFWDDLSLEIYMQSNLYLSDYPNVVRLLHAHHPDIMLDAEILPAVL